MQETLGTVVDTIAGVDPRFLLAALVFHLANFGFRSLAWRNVLRAAYPDRPVPLLGIAGAYAAGVAINAFTPVRGGDLAKIALVRTRIRGSSVPTIASSMGVVSLFDVVLGAGLIGLLAALGLLPSPPGLPSLPGLPALVAARPEIVVPAALALVAAMVLLRRRLAPQARTIWEGLRAGAAILGSPRRYATEVVPVQLSAWACRIGAAYFLLAAFGVPASLAAALIVVMVGGLATVVPTPGGVGTQQVLLATFLHATASTTALVSFSLGMQAAVTAVNAIVGVAAAMLMLRTLRPAAALRSHVRALRAGVPAA
ncbi:MAG TPA: lysylphosphatidylglycerol synthase transmembrane domain-containing protein [Gaiellaceae bacterium]|nr:lysylphosphatidylglycerol synthase transmembrane domain-containing protein [Gaiellaceae bacterium]